MPTPFFADLVRELCQEGGAGPLTPTGAVPGHRRFSEAVPPGVAFHYAVAGIARPEQWEVGTGRIGGDGRQLRDTVAASSNDNAAVDFAPGLKTIALTVGADWFAASDTQAATLAGNVVAVGSGLAALTDALDAKQPLSTTHGAASAGAADDQITVRRGTGWINIPLAALAFRDGGGRYLLGGALGAPDGSPSAPAIGFAGDSNTGLWQPASDVLGFATAGAERMRIAPNGRVTVGGAAANYRINIAEANPGRGILADFVNDAGAGLNGAQISFTQNGIANWCFGQVPGVSALAAYRDRNGAFDGTEMWRWEASGASRPGADNAYPIGTASHRVSTVYAGTGTINTSDARDKFWRGAANEAELRAARRIMAELGFYQWTDAIAVKGEAGARRHFGVRAQAVWAIMADEGLIDPIDADGVPGDTPYAFLCWDALNAEAAETESAGGAARGRFGIRPDQLALFLIAGLERRVAGLEDAA